MGNGWHKEGNFFLSTKEPCNELPPGIYEAFASSDGKKYFTKLEAPTDASISLPGLPSDYILDQIKLFWKKKNTYEKYGLIQKRGIMMYGPPGCGKTSIVNLLCKHLIDNGGIVFQVTNFVSATACLTHFRSVEPTRPVMTLMEDIEGLFVGDAGPGQIKAALSFLDGQDQLNNVVHVATTNEPEGLADRFIKRPGRFDIVIGVFAPKRETREAYLRYVCKDNVPEDKLQEIVTKTEGLGLSYLREIASTYLCLDIPLDETIARLQSNFKMRSLTNKETRLGFTIGYEESPK